MSQEEKHWLVVGLALNKTLLPQLVPIIEQEVRAEYKKLIGPPHHIDTQAPAGHLIQWPFTGKQYLKYENINGNDKHKWSNGKPDYSKFTYHVTSYHDFAKLYLPSSMAKFSSFSECDVSAMLILLGSVPVFSTATKVGADDVMVNVKNEWAHCNITDCDAAKFTECFQYMTQLVKFLALPSAQETLVLSELKDLQIKGEF